MQSMMSRRAWRLFYGVAASAVALAAGAAQAQDTAEGPAEVSELVVVGVTKQASLVQDVPTAITAYSGAQLEAQGVKDVRDISTVTPGFSVRAAGNNPTALNLMIRGQIQNDNIATLEPSVGVYLDEMYVARAYGLNSELLDINSVQVLKGPQGTLFGRNTSAGAVLLQTNDPVYNDVSALMRVNYGNYNFGAGTAVANFGGDAFAIRGAIYVEERGAHQKDVRTGQGFGDRRTIQGRVKASLRPVDYLTLLVSGEWYDGKIDGPARQNLYFNLGGAGVDPAVGDRALFGGDPDKVAVTQPSQVPGAPAQGLFNDMKTETYIAKAIVDMGFGELKWINGYRQITGANLIDLDGASPTTGAHFTQGFQDLEQWSSELQLTGQVMDGALTYALGGSYLKEEGFDQSRSSTNGAATWSNFLGEIDNKSWGVYGQLHYQVTDALGVTGGVRYSEDEKGVTTRSAVALNNATIVTCLPSLPAPAGPALLANGCARGRTDTFDNVSYTVGVDYDITDDVMLYAKHSRGYRSGAQQLRSLTLNDTAPAQPEIVDEQEIGLKTQWLDRRLRLNVAGYHNKVKDAQRSVILNVGGFSQTILENADIETWGGEAEVNFEVARGINVFASGSLTDPKYNNYAGFVAASGVLTPKDKKDSFFVGVVRKQFTVGGSYRRYFDFGRFDANLSYAWQDKMHQTGDRVEDLIIPAAQGGGGIGSVASAEALIDAATSPSVGVVNARASLSFGPANNYEVAIWGRNIFDERTYPYALYLGGLNYVSAYWNDPATYGLSVAVKY